jgi:hypothetical protein
MEIWEIQDTLCVDSSDFMCAYIWEKMLPWNCLSEFDLSHTFLFFFFCSSGAEDWTEGLVLVRQVPYPVSVAPVLLLLVF